MENNRAKIAGTVITEPTKYECCGESFLSFMLETARLSGTTDKIPVNLPMYLMNDLHNGDKICLTGQVRTYNKVIDDKRRLIVVFFAQEREGYTKDVNEVEFSGYLCAAPLYRITPLGRSICDIKIAINRLRGKSDYIPCISWGRVAQYISTLEIGEEIKISGRFQSRLYEKKLDDKVETRTAYEVSIYRIETAD